MKLAIIRSSWIDPFLVGSFKLKALGAFLLLWGFWGPQIVDAAASDPIKFIPVQDGGRVKPFDSFAREALELIYGKQSYEGKPAHEIVMTWILHPQAWQDKEIFEIRHHLVRRGLGYGPEVRRVTANDLFSRDRLPTLMQELRALRESKIKLDPYGQALSRLEGQLFVFREIATGRLLRLIPKAGEEAWISLNELPEEGQNKFLDVTRAFVATLDPKVETGAAKADLEEAVRHFKDYSRLQDPGLYDQQVKKVSWEVHYNSLHPFMWSYIFYFATFFLLCLFWVFKKKFFIHLSTVAVVGGIFFHIYGFVLRTYLTERAPVTNMYETVVWVSFGVVLFALVLEWIYRWRVILAAGAAVAAFCLLLSDLSPTVLDPTLQPLEPVLRSNFWLTTHVLTITISYAAFFLAFGLADFGLFLILRNEKKFEEKLKAISLAIYRCIQIGVGFLGPGIILGGIWADYSWGRFWGWDPKETWALIALLGYVAILHARIVNWVGYFGMMVSSILSFNLVIMAWYGVNFVLGAGLHSYGFGAGGVEYVSAFAIVHILYVAFVAALRWQKLKSLSHKSNVGGAS
jgi:cytochrome c-type biogenesis protein CcsB